MRPIGISLAMLCVVGCVGGPPDVSCDYPHGYLGSSDHVCVDFVAGYSDLAAHESCAMHPPLVAGDLSTAPCVATGRVARCRVTITSSETVTEDLSFYSGTVTDVAAACPPAMPVENTTYELIPN